MSAGDDQPRQKLVGRQPSESEVAAGCGGSGSTSGTLGVPRGTEPRSGLRRRRTRFFIYLRIFLLKLTLENDASIFRCDCASLVAFTNVIQKQNV